ncbi:MAG: exonuclease sbcCD subunit D [Thiotrichales bacterium]|nr:MAG: exonuclease sbcCD subunit D [Thiotrichales bacterium]
MTKLKILHTSDWHLGHSLHGHNRAYEHTQFLEWLLLTIKEQDIDVVIITGDIFETSMPQASAQKMYYQFLHKLKQKLPKIQVVVIGGNHDSAMRLNAPRDLLENFGIHVVGGLSYQTDGSIDCEELIYPLYDKAGNITAWCAAVPFLHGTDLAMQDIEEDVQDSFVGKIRKIYHHIINIALSKCTPDQALIVTGHCYMANTELSELSERRILGGNQHALPIDIFSDKVSYVALGHLHKPQKVIKDHIRYSGSPIPLSMTERNYKHQVLKVEIENNKLHNITPILIPRFVDMLRIPNLGTLTLEKLLEELQALEVRADTNSNTPKPFLEVSILMEQPEANLTQIIKQALQDKRINLVKITTEYSGSNQSLAETNRQIQLESLSIEEVFKKCYQYRYKGEPNQELMELFHMAVQKSYEDNG